MSESQLFVNPLTEAILRFSTLSQVKDHIDPIDQAEDQKQLIMIRQFLKKAKIIKWRKAKLRWVIKLIKSLETTTKSRGGRLLRNMNMEES